MISLLLVPGPELPSPNRPRRTGLAVSDAVQMVLARTR